MSYQEIYNDKDKSIRGGIPILFPICGDLSEGYLIGDKKYFLKQHGFARDECWQLGLLNDGNGINLSLKDNISSLEYYQFKFHFKLLNLSSIISVTM